MPSDSTETQSPKSKRVAVLAVKNSGIGDILKQVEFFFWICEYYNYTPKLFLKHNAHRREWNEFNRVQLFDFMGIQNSDYVADYFDREKAIDISEIGSYQHEGMDPIFVFLRIRFNQNGQFTECFKSVNPNSLPHPKISKMLRESELSRRILEKRKQGTKKLSIHLRRGDITQMPASVLDSILKEGIDRSLIIHCKGIFKQEDVKNELPEDIFSRFKPISAYKRAIDNFIEKHGNDYEINLFSDGMTRLALKIKEEHSHILENPKTSLWQIERCLEGELMPLVQISEHCLIGENNNNLFDTIVDALSAEYVIAASLPFLKQISRNLGLDVKFIKI